MSQNQFTLARLEYLCKTESVKEHDIPMISVVSEHAHNSRHNPLWNKVKFIYHDPHCYTCRVKEAINIRTSP